MEFQKICSLKIIWNEKWDKSCMLSQLQEGLIIKFCNKQPLQKTLLAWSPEALFFKALNWVSGASVLSRESRICKRWDFGQESFIRTFFYMSLCNQSSFWSPFHQSPFDQSDFDRSPFDRSPFDRSDFDRSPMDWSPFDRSPFVWSLYDKSLFIQSLWGQVGLFRCSMDLEGNDYNFPLQNIADLASFLLQNFWKSVEDPRLLFFFISCSLK